MLRQIDQRFENRFNINIMGSEYDLTSELLSVAEYKAERFGYIR